MPQKLIEIAWEIVTAQVSQNPNEHPLGSEGGYGRFRIGPQMDVHSRGEL